MLQSVNLRDYMLTNPLRVKPEDNVIDAMKVIIDNKISGCREWQANRADHLPAVTQRSDEIQGLSHWRCARLWIGVGQYRRIHLDTHLFPLRHLRTNPWQHRLEYRCAAIQCWNGHQHSIAERIDLQHMPGPAGRRLQRQLTPFNSDLMPGIDDR